MLLRLNPTTYSMSWIMAVLGCFTNPALCFLINFNGCIKIRTCTWTLDKMMVKYGTHLGTKVTYDEIKDLHLGECVTCMKCKMRTFALPLSINRRIYEVFEFLSCDHIPFSKTVGGGPEILKYIRGYTGIVLFADRATSKIFNYLVKSKSEWLQCLKNCIAEYIPSTRNPRSANLAYLPAATEVHSTEFAAIS